MSRVEQSYEPAYTIDMAVNIKLYEFELTELDPEHVTQNIIEFMQENLALSNMSNVQAWHSSYQTHHLTDRFDSVIQAMMSRISKIPDYPGTTILFPIDSWAIVYKKNDWTKVHDHGFAAYSCVYYPDVDADSAPIIFLDNTQTIKIQPKKNHLLVFPGYVQHCVPKSKTDKLRIAYSANFTVIPKIYNDPNVRKFK